MSELWKKIQRGLLGPQERRRCRRPDAFHEKISHGNLPTEEDLNSFESSYAGPQTGALMERHSAWRAGTATRNKNCLVCLQSIRRDPKCVLCMTCIRVLHVKCLKEQAPHGDHRMHCPLCIKRRWHLISPLTPTQRDGQSADDFHMKRVRRYHRWHKYNCKHIEEWSKLHDDGSLDSDRSQLIAMCVARTLHETHPRLITNHEPSKEAEVLDDGANHESGVSEGGEAAEYYNPNASRLDSVDRSESGHQEQPEDVTKHSKRSLASSTLSSIANSAAGGDGH